MELSLLAKPNVQQNTFLTDREADKFIELIEYISPDQAFLAFGKYSEDEKKLKK